MSVGTVLYGLLHGDGPIVALVADRIRPSLAKQTESDPHIVYTEVSNVPQTSLQGFTSGLRRARVQIDCYSRVYDQAQQVGDAVEALLKAYKDVNVSSVVLDRRSLYEDETQYHRVQMDVSLWLTEA